jgi:hypothetical protein
MTSVASSILAWRDVAAGYSHCKAGEPSHNHPALAVYRSQC